MASERLTQRIRELGVFLEKRLITNLEKQGIKATGELMQSIEMAVEVGLGSIDLVERHAFYGDFVDRGRKPGTRRIPVDALEAWIKQRRFEWGMKDARGVAFYVQKRIFEEGIKPRPWLTETINTSGYIIQKEVSVAAEEETEILIDNLVRFSQKQFTITA